ncbi:alpha subunit of pyruvate dehydrogenase [Chytriomyces hyalinus]|nr:alpha subunit of pyruvate dehydrogenase [Chytriomyces hyalinus]
MKICIVGGGVFGLSTALSLQRRGHSVTVFDRLPVPAEDAASTDISKVIRPDYASQRLYQRLALASIKAFKSQWNPDAERRLGRALYVETGCLFATRASEMNAFERESIETLALDGVRVEKVQRERVAQLMGNAFANEFPYGYFNASAGFAYSGLTIEYMALLAQEADVKFVCGGNAGTFAAFVYSPSNGKTVVGIKTMDGAVHHADRVIVAAGSWTPSLVPQLRVWFADVSETGFYGFPVSDLTGELKIANHGPGFKSSFHLDTSPASRVSQPAKSVVTSTAIPKPAVDMYRKFLAHAFPETNQLDITRTRLCWYCESWDGNFFIDAVPGMSNCFVATGGSGHGFKFAPVLGDVIADIVEGKPSEFRELFQWREKPVGCEDELDAIRKGKAGTAAPAQQTRRLFGFASKAAAPVAASPSTEAIIGTNAAGERTYSFAFQKDDFELHNFDALPEVSSPVTAAQLVDMYRQMVRIRRIETASDQLYKAKLIRGFCHLSTGQEAIAAGLESAITKKDSIITSYRCHGFALTRGTSATGVIAELMGRSAGCSKGKGGSMHIFGPEFYGGNGIVGAQVPLGAGVALAHKYRGLDAMCFSLYGDGAANQGQVFEAYNMAKLWALPVVFACENNLYGMGTSATRAAASTKYYTRGDFIPGIRVNGMDALAVREASKIARDWTIANGPLVMEYVTYRYGGHSMSDPGTTYRTREEIQNMRSNRDCITQLKNRILESGASTEEELKAIDKEARVEMDQAVEESKASPEPDLSVLNADIYAPGTYDPSTVRGCEPFYQH